MYHRRGLKQIGPRNPLWIAASGALGGGVYGIVYLINDEFTTDRAAGSVDGTAAEPGPGTRHTPDVTDNYISSGILTRSTSGLYYDLVTRFSGVALFMDVPTTNGMAIGFIYNNTIPTGYTYNEIMLTFIGGGTVFSVRKKNNTYIQLYSTVAGSQVTAIIILLSVGAIVVLYIGGAYKLGYVTRVDADNVYPDITSNGANTYSVDTFRCAQLPAPFNTDNGIATDVHSGSVSAGTTFTHEADCWIEYTVTTLPSAGQTETRFRVQDVSNYWQVTVDSTGAIDLDEVVSGTPTQRGTAAGVVSSGHRVCIVADDTTITVYSNDTLRFSYTSASNFKTATAGELETLGTGGAVSNLITMPRTLSGRAATILNAFAAGQS